MGNYHGLIVASNDEHARKIIKDHKNARVLGSVDYFIGIYDVDWISIGEIPNLVRSQNQQFFSILIEENSIYRSSRFSTHSRMVPSPEYSDIVERRLATYPQDTRVKTIFVHSCTLQPGIYNAA